LSFILQLNCCTEQGNNLTVQPGTKFNCYQNCNNSPQENSWIHETPRFLPLSCQLQHLLIAECLIVQCIKVSVDLDTLILALTPSSLPIYPHAVNVLHTSKSLKKPLSAMALTTSALEGFQQDQAHASSFMVRYDAYALGLGIIKPQAMVSAKAAHHHGDTGLPQ
jgi:hypothetical protein